MSIPQPTREMTVVGLGARHLSTRRPEERSLELAEIEAMIVGAEAELVALKRRLGQECRVTDPSDPFDPIRCLELWLCALYATRARLLQASGQVSSRPN